MQRNKGFTMKGNRASSTMKGNKASSTMKSNKASTKQGNKAPTLQSPCKSTLRDWANLTEDIIIIIGNKASTIIMYVHLRAVCKPWRKALIPHPRHLPPQFPWLLLPQLIPPDTYRRNRVEDSHLCFYDSSQSKTHRFEFPSLRGKDLCGSNYGWLVLKQNDKLLLLNPITRRSIHLPSLEAIHNRQPPLYRPLDEIPNYCTQKVVLSSSPADADCIVVSCSPLSSLDWELIFCQIGDAHWTGLKPRDMSRRLLDFTLHKNSVYTVDHKRRVSVYDLQMLASWTYPKIIKYNTTKDRIHLVGGDAEFEGPVVVNSPLNLRVSNKIHVYKWFDDRNGKQDWRRVKNIGKCVLFLTRTNCTNIQLEEEQGDEIYFDVRHDVCMYMYTCCVGINRVNLQNGGAIPFNHSPLEVFPKRSGDCFWFTPSLEDLETPSGSYL